LKPVFRQPARIRDYTGEKQVLMPMSAIYIRVILIISFKFCLLDQKV